MRVGVRPHANALLLYLFFSRGESSLPPPSPVQTTREKTFHDIFSPCKHNSTDQNRSVRTHRHTERWATFSASGWGAIEAIFISDSTCANTAHDSDPHCATPQWIYTRRSLAATLRDAAGSSCQPRIHRTRSRGEEACVAPRLAGVRWPPRRRPGGWDLVRASDSTARRSS